MAFPSKSFKYCHGKLWQKAVRISNIGKAAAKPLYQVPPPLPWWNLMMDFIINIKILLDCDNSIIHEKWNNLISNESVHTYLCQMPLKAVQKLCIYIFLSIQCCSYTKTIKYPTVCPIYLIKWPFFDWSKNPLVLLYMLIYIRYQSPRNLS